MSKGLVSSHSYSLDFLRSTLPWLRHPNFFFLHTRKESIHWRGDCCQKGEQYRVGSSLLRVLPSSAILSSKRTSRLRWTRSQSEYHSSLRSGILLRSDLGISTISTRTLRYHTLFTSSLLLSFLSIPTYLSGPII